MATAQKTLQVRGAIKFNWKQKPQTSSADVYGEERAQERNNCLWPSNLSGNVDVVNSNVFKMVRASKFNFLEPESFVGKPRKLEYTSLFCNSREKR